MRDGGVLVAGHHDSCIAVVKRHTQTEQMEKTGQVYISDGKCRPDLSEKKGNGEGRAESKEEDHLCIPELSSTFT